MNFDLQQVTVQFDAIPALHNITCSIGEGASVILTGPTGAGKTTFLKLLYADLLPSSGSIFINGQKSSTLNQKQLRTLRSSMGIMLQDGKLMPSLTVFENVIAPLMIIGYSKRDANKRCLEVLAEIGVSYVRDKFPHQLSGGEKHLVGLARAIIHSPSCIICDEPTGNVDSFTAQIIIRILQNENQRGSTTVIATHDAELINAFSTSAHINLIEGEIQRA